MFNNISKLFPNKMVRVILVISTLLLIASIFAPLLFTSFSIIDFSETGQIGDTIQGIMSPFIGIAGILLTFVAFYIQFEANEKQKSALEEQNKAIAKQNRASSITAFESNLFELLRIHQSILDETKVMWDFSGTPTTTRYGQDLIEWITAQIVRNYDAIKAEHSEVSQKQATILAFLFCYYGKNLYENKKLSLKYKECAPALLKNNQQSCNILKNGFGSALSRYFRNIYQIYKYIDSAKFLEQHEKYYYSKIVRSTLSTAEQNLLYYDMLSPLGEAWTKEELVFKYKPIKNMSLEENKLYSPVEWIKSFDTKNEMDTEYIYDFFEYYDDEINKFDGRGD